MNGPVTTRAARRRRRALRRLVVVLVAVVVAVALAGTAAYELIHRGGGSVADWRGPGYGRVIVVVAPGATTTAIGEALYTHGVVASVGAFTAAAVGDPRSTDIQPGAYRLRHQMSAAGALALLEDPGSMLVGRVTVPEGTPLKVLLPLLARAGHLPLAALRAAVDDPAELGLPPYADGHVEGFLFPATYDVAPHSNPVTVLRTMVARFEQAAAAVHLVAGAAALHRTPLQVVIIASILEGESARPGDDPKVAGVFYNRLRAGMPLGSEFTAVYSGNSRTSPYNTYYHRGFPPGAYDSPGQAALLAALHPAHVPWLYFVTLPSGRTLFESTAAGFETARAECVAQGGCR